MNYKNQIYQLFLQGTVRLYVLHQASQRPVYGGGISRDLRKLGYHISPGSLYPLLRSLEEARFLRCRLRVYKGRLRKYYELTEVGKSCLDEVRKEVVDLVREVIFEGQPELSKL